MRTQSRKRKRQLRRSYEKEIYRCTEKENKGSLGMNLQKSNFEKERGIDIVIIEGDCKG